MKIAVTGCAGFIGSWVSEKALEAGHEVIGIDNLSSNVNFTPKDVIFHNTDINNNIKPILKDVQAIVHAAAYAELRHNWDSPDEREKLFKNNEIGTRSILDQMPDVPIIFLSTAAVYGSLSNFGKSDPLVEEDANPGLIESPYAASKLACESYVTAWSHKRGTPWYSLRLVNQVGKRTHRGVIPDFLRMIRENNHIHAADNGKQRKNWVSVEDTASVILRLLDRKTPVPSGIYTVSSRERWSWRDIVDVMYKMHKEKNSKTPPFTLSAEDRLGGSIGDPLNLCVSSKKLDQYYVCSRPVEQAVKDALIYLGWT